MDTPAPLPLPTTQLGATMKKFFLALVAVATVVLSYVIYSSKK